MAGNLDFNCFWFPIKGGETLQRLAGCTTEEAGAWLLLKIYLLSHPALPSSFSELQRIAGCDRKTVKRVLPFFDHEGGVYYCKEIGEIKWKIIATQEKRKEAGKKGASARWGSA